MKKYYKILKIKEKYLKLQVEGTKTTELRKDNNWKPPTRIEFRKHKFVEEKPPVIRDILLQINMKTEDLVELLYNNKKLEFSIFCTEHETKEELKKTIYYTVQNRDYSTLFIFDQSSKNIEFFI